MRLLLALLIAAASREKWSSDLPLQLSVRTAADLAFKSVAERQYLIFNLLAAGKVAFDAGDFPAAADKWEALLQVPNLEPEVDKVVRPLAEEARLKAGVAAGAPAAPRVQPRPAAAAPPPAEKRPALVSVEGTISGGGAAGPGGAVITLKRTDGGPMPRLQPGRKLILQRGKAFVPHVLAVPVGSSIVFRNEDPINHNVFSLSPHLDTGLYGQGSEKEETFEKPGVVQLLCNIHSAMLGYVVVVDTPLFAQADGTGAFAIRGVPPGEYEVEAWHENASQPTRQKLSVPREGARLSLTVAGDRQPSGYPPDKYGKPRQTQLGY